jgi:hypothetical protein
MPSQVADCSRRDVHISGAHVRHLDAARVQVSGRLRAEWMGKHDAGDFLCGENWWAGSECTYIFMYVPTCSM